MSVQIEKRKLRIAAGERCVQLFSGSMNAPSVDMPLLPPNNGWFKV